MKQDKTERLIIRITENLKSKIETFAKKQNVTTSEFVRTVLEDAVCKRDKEIEECVMMVTTITKHINNIMEELVFTSITPDINRLTRELRHYKKLAYEHQLNAIEMILEEGSYNDAKTQSLIEISDQALKALNNYLEKTSENNDDGITLIFETIQEKINLLEDNMWNSTYKLYTHLCNKYFNK